MTYKMCTRSLHVTFSKRWNPHLKTSQTGGRFIKIVLCATFPIRCIYSLFCKMVFWSSQVGGERRRGAWWICKTEKFTAHGNFVLVDRNITSDEMISQQNFQFFWAHRKNVKSLEQLKAIFEAVNWMKNQNSHPRKTWALMPFLPVNGKFICFPLLELRLVANVEEIGGLKPSSFIRPNYQNISKTAVLNQKFFSKIFAWATLKNTYFILN